jgi:FKBP-type peptidyl-prolyl cis-trans isomerase
MNITGTGIAVALAVIVALGLLFFGPQVFTLFNHSTATAVTSATTTMQDDQTSDQTSLGQTAQTSAGGASGIPQNPTELMMSDQTIGTGDVAEPGDQVTVSYVGMLTDGTVFDASANHGGSFTFTLGGGQVIKGWDEGVAGMKVGGKRELVIPASLGYGAQANGPIPANSTLVFEIELLKVQAPQ